MANLGDPTNTHEVLLAMRHHWGETFRMAFPEVAIVYEDNEVIVAHTEVMSAVMATALGDWANKNLDDDYALYDLERHDMGIHLEEVGGWAYANDIPGPFQVLGVNQKINWTAPDKVDIADLVPSIIHAWQLLEKNEQFHGLIHADQPGFPLGWVKKTRDNLKTLHDLLAE